MSVLLFLPLVVTVVTRLFLLVMLHSISFLPEVMMAPPSGIQLENSVMPSVFISSLPWGGSEIAGELFLNSDNFVYARVPEELKVPAIFAKQFINFCIWKNSSDENGLPMKRLYDWLIKPDLIVKEKNTTNSNPADIRDQSHIHITVLRWLAPEVTGTWIQSIIGDGTRILRDPRSWVTHVLNNDLFDDVKDSVTEALHSSKCLFKNNYA